MASVPSFQSAHPTVAVHLLHSLPAPLQNDDEGVADPAPQSDSATQGANQITAIAGSLIDQVQKHQKDYSKKATDLVKRSEELLDAQEAQQKRFNKILETWERQQKEYQAYLDTLPKTPAPKPAAPAN